jgi:hypothetical protein
MAFDLTENGDATRVKNHCHVESKGDRNPSSEVLGDNNEQAQQKRL